MVTLSFATGTEPGKWLRRYTERTGHPALDAAAADDPVARLLNGAADVALVRLPDPRVEERAAELHRVVLYEEARGVGVPAESVYAVAGGPIDAADIAGETCHYRPTPSGDVDPAKVRELLPVVAAGVGVVVAPFPLVRQLAGRRVAALKYRDDSVPQTSIALVWPKEKDSPAIQDFVGIAKGRTANSTRIEKPKKRSAREKTLAKQARRAARAAPKGRRRGRR